MDKKFVERTHATGMARIVSLAVLALFAAHVLYSRVLPEVYRLYSPASSAKTIIPPEPRRERPLYADLLLFFYVGPSHIFRLAGLPEVQRELDISDEKEADLGNLQRDTEKEWRRLKILDFSSERTRWRPMGRKMEAEMREAEKEIDDKLARILDADQVKRLHELMVRYQGVLALWTRAHRVTAELDLTEEQLAQIRAKLHAIYRDRYPAAARLFAPGESIFGAFLDMMLEAQSRGETRRETCAQLFNEERAFVEERSAEVLAVLTEKQRAKYREMRGKEFQFTSWSWWAAQRDQERGESLVPLVTPNEK